MSETSSEASSAAAGGRAPEPQHRRVVLKVGTNLLTGGGERLDRAIMSVIADQIAEALEGGCELILVTSGAIAAGRDRLAATRARRAGDDAAELPHYLTRRQVLAAIGQGPCSRSGTNCSPRARSRSRRRCSAGPTSPTGRATSTRATRCSRSSISASCRS